jgi:hypothetical protein
MSFSMSNGPEPPTPAAEKVKRHPKYYLNGGDVHFLVSISAAANDPQAVDIDACPVVPGRELHFPRSSIFLRAGIGFLP